MLSTPAWSDGHRPETGASPHERSALELHLLGVGEDVIDLVVEVRAAEPLTRFGSLRQQLIGITVLEFSRALKPAATMRVVGVAVPVVGDGVVVGVDVSEQDHRLVGFGSAGPPAETSSVAWAARMLPRVRVVPWLVAFSRRCRTPRGGC